MERLVPLLNPKLQHPLDGAENLNYIQNMHHAKELSQTLCVYVRVLYRLHNQDYAYLYSRSHTYTTAYSDLQVYMSGFFFSTITLHRFRTKSEHFKVHLYQSVNALKRARWPWPFLHPTPPAKILILTNIIDTICYAI